METMQDYKMLAEIPIKDVPDTVSIQEAKVISEIWLKTKIPDAELISFEKEVENASKT